MWFDISLVTDYKVSGGGKLEYGMLSMVLHMYTACQLAHVRSSFFYPTRVERFLRTHQHVGRSTSTHPSHSAIVASLGTHPPTPAPANSPTPTRGLDAGG